MGVLGGEVRHEERRREDLLEGIGKFCVVLCGDDLVEGCCCWRNKENRQGRSGDGCSQSGMASEGGSMEGNMV